MEVVNTAIHHALLVMGKETWRMKKGRVQFGHALNLSFVQRA